MSAATPMPTAEARKTAECPAARVSADAVPGRAGADDARVDDGEDGEADRAADVHHRVDSRGGGTGILSFDAGEGEVLERREQHREADAERDECRKHLDDVAALRRHPAEVEQPRCRDDRTTDHEWARAGRR
jgi:hypothetical protein